MEDKKPVEAEDVVMQQGYPSPSMEDGDAQFYNVDSRRAPEGKHIPIPEDEPHAHGLPAVDRDQELGPEQHELQELQREIQEEPTPQRHQNSAEELQLAAQLTQDLAAQGLAPVLDETSPPAHAQYNPEAQKYEPMDDTDYSPSQDTPFEDAQPTQLEDAAAADEAQSHAQEEPTLPEQIQAGLENHDRELENALHQQSEPPQQQQPRSQQTQSQPQLEQPPQPQPQQQQQFELSAPPLAPLPPQTHHFPPQFVQGLPHQLPTDPPAQAQYLVAPNGPPPRKRVKVSRACDECRRKKIRCDAPAEGVEQPCSNCQRSSAPCLFSRVPQKRGPSKGYIKELADRIHSIEGRIRAAGEADPLDALAKRIPAHALLPPSPGDAAQRKRPFSSISEDEPFTPNSARQWTSEHRPIQPYQTTTPHYFSEATSNDLSLRTTTTSTGRTVDTPVQPPAAKIDELAQDGVSTVAAVGEIDDMAFDVYLSCIHPTFPVLAKTKSRVQSVLSQCPAPLQLAFFEAFFSMLRPYLSSDISSVRNGIFDQAFLKDADGKSKTADDFLKEWNREAQPQSSVTDLVTLQTLVMMAIETDHHGLQSRPSRRTKNSLLWEAIGLARSMRIHVPISNSTPGPEFDFDSDDNVAIRTWWTLVMLDRWNAIVTASETLIDEKFVVIRPGLKLILGEVVFKFIQLAKPLGNLAESSQMPLTKLDSETSHFIGSLFDFTLDTWRLNLPEDFTFEKQPTLHLAYWHTLLVHHLFKPTTKSDTLLEICQRIFGLLTTYPQLLSPLSHHFVSLAGLVLLELLSVEDTKQEASKMTTSVLESSIPQTPWTAPVLAMLAAKVQSQPPASSAVQNLQQPADVAAATKTSETTSQPNGVDANGTETVPDALAAGEPEPRTTSEQRSYYAGHGFDSRQLLATGYLNALKQAPGSN